MSDSYFDSDEKNVTADEIHFFIEEPKQFYNQLIAAYSTTVPEEGGELYQISRDTFKNDHIRAVLLYVNGFMDAVKVVKENGVAPRAKAMAELGYS